MILNYNWSIHAVDFMLLCTSFDVAVNSIESVTLKLKQCYPSYI